MRILVIILLGLVLSGCVSIQGTKESPLVETFNYPYKKVFYACEDAVPFVHTFTGGWYIKDARVEDGYIYAHRNGSVAGAIILVEKVDEKTTRVRVSEEAKFVFYNEFMRNLRRILERSNAT